MSDQFNALTVVFAHDIRDDQARELISAIVAVATASAREYVKAFWTATGF